MGVALFNADTLNLILRQFAIFDGEYTFQPMTSGLINDTFLVSLANRPLYVLQRINHNVFPNVSGLVENIDQALTHLHSETYTQLQLIKTKAEKTYYTGQEEPVNYWKLIAFIEGSQTFDNPPNEKVAFEAGRIIGQFHTLLQKSDVTTFVDTIPRFHDLSLRREQFHEALKTANPKNLASAKIAISFANDIISELNAMQIGNLPVRVCHNDTKLNNILFSKKSKKALCLIDLDTLMAGYFHYDFGDAVRTIANTAAEDEQDHDKITFEKPLFEVFVRGLASNGKFLSKEEIHSLPYGVLLMPFLHGLRALTDYLQNNKYYKVSYENQNLDRALSLFDFTQKALSELEYFKTTINRILKPL